MYAICHHRCHWENNFDEVHLIISILVCNPEEVGESACTATTFFVYERRRRGRQNNNKPVKGRREEEKKKKKRQKRRREFKDGLELNKHEGQSLMLHTYLWQHEGSQPRSHASIYLVGTTFHSLAVVCLSFSRHRRHFDDPPCWGTFSCCYSLLVQRSFSSISFGRVVNKLDNNSVVLF